MDLIDAFLTISGLAYFIALSHKCTLNLKPLQEKILFNLCGLAILLSVHLIKHWVAYLGLSIFYTVAAMLSWLGVSQWRFLDWEKPSPIHQVAMFAWDLGIAISFMSKL